MKKKNVAVVGALVVFAVLAFAIANPPGWIFKSAADIPSRTTTFAFTNLGFSAVQPYSMEVKFGSAATGNFTISRVRGGVKTMWKLYVLAAATDVTFDYNEFIGWSFVKDDQFFIDNATGETFTGVLSLISSQP